MGLKFERHADDCDHTRCRRLEARLREQEDEIKQLRAEVAAMQVQLEGTSEDGRCGAQPGAEPDGDKPERGREASWWKLAPEGIGSRPIGKIMSSFPEKNGTPRQGSVAPASKAVLRVRFGNNPHHAVEGLADFSHVWLLFLFHDNGPLTAPRAKVQPPRLLGATKGVFATRAPHRCLNVWLYTRRFLEFLSVHVHVHAHVQ